MGRPGKIRSLGVSDFLGKIFRGDDHDIFVVAFFKIIDVTGAMRGQDPSGHDPGLHPEVVDFLKVEQDRHVEVIQMHPVEAPQGAGQSLGKGFPIRLGDAPQGSPPVENGEDFSEHSPWAVNR